MSWLLDVLHLPRHVQALLGTPRCRMYITCAARCVFPRQLHLKSLSPCNRKLSCHRPQNVTLIVRTLAHSLAPHNFGKSSGKPSLPNISVIPFPLCFELSNKCSILIYSNLESAIPRWIQQAGSQRSLVRAARSVASTLTRTTILRGHKPILRSLDWIYSPVTRVAQFSWSKSWSSRWGHKNKMISDDFVVRS